MGKRAYRGSSPPGQVVMVGSSIPWTEAEWYGLRFLGPKHHPDCRCGCVRPIAVYRWAGRWPIALEPWAVSTRRQAGRGDCPNGCRDRDLGLEKRGWLDRICLRCCLHTADREGWQIPTPFGGYRPRDTERAAEAVRQGRRGRPITPRRTKARAS